jgi:hypothetical protein
MDGEVECWGKLEDPEVAMRPESLRAEYLAFARTTGCAIERDSRRVVCWGPDWTEGELDNLGTHLSLGSVPVVCWHRYPGGVACQAAQTYVERIASGIWAEYNRVALQKILDGVPAGEGWTRLDSYDGVHACALSSEQLLHCWGHGYEYFGGGAPSARVLDFALGHNFGCALLEDGAPVCWGQTSGRAPPPGRFDRVFAGWYNVCYRRVEEQTVICVGGDQHGNVTDVPAQEQFDHVSIGRHICGLTLDRRVVCWGRNDHGQANVPEHINTPSDTKDGDE